MKTLLILALVVSSCASMKARDAALLPTAQLAWVGVHADLERGIADAVEDGDLLNSAAMDALVEHLDEVLSLGASHVLLRQIPWDPTLREFALRGIQDREDLARLDQFSQAFEQLLGTHISTTPSSRGRGATIPGNGPTTDPAAVAILTAK